MPHYCKSCSPNMNFPFAACPPPGRFPTRGVRPQVCRRAAQAVSAEVSPLSHSRVRFRPGSSPCPPTHRRGADPVPSGLRRERSGRAGCLLFLPPGIWRILPGGAGRRGGRGCRGPQLTPPGRPLLGVPSRASPFPVPGASHLTPPGRPLLGVPSRASPSPVPGASAGSELSLLSSPASLSAFLNNWRGRTPLLPGLRREARVSPRPHSFRQGEAPGGRTPPLRPRREALPSPNNDPPANLARPAAPRAPPQRRGPCPPGRPRPGPHCWPAPGRVPRAAAPRGQQLQPASGPAPPTPFQVSWRASRGAGPLLHAPTGRSGERAGAQDRKSVV